MGLTAVFTIVFLISFNKELSAVKSTYDQIKPGLEAIEQAVENGENEVEIPLVTPSDSKYDPYNGALYAGDSPTLWGKCLDGEILWNRKNNRGKIKVGGVLCLTMRRIILD